MPKIELTNVTKRWNSFYAVDNLNLTIEDNAFVTLLGPSGCGKTTTLRVIAGLETPTSGRIKIGDKVVYDSALGINVPASKRKVGFLFQNYALWPNMTVYQNIAFGLKNIKDELPIIDYEYLTNKQIINVLNKWQTIIDIANDCTNKNQKINEERFLIKLISTYAISYKTAQRILKYNIHKMTNQLEEVKKIREELEFTNQQITKKYQIKNQLLNENGEVIENGTIKKLERKLTSEEVDLRVRKVAKIVKVEMFMDRYPSELSGGQQQRVAIARTLAPGPHVLFMDEPLSNLDAKLRLEMRYELQRLHLKTGSTFVYVTHDQMEAMTLATKICLINNGILQQYEEPLKIYNNPINTFVADFVGNPSINFIEAKLIEETNCTLKLKLLNNHYAVFLPNKNLNLRKWYQTRDETLTKLKLEAEENNNKKDYIEKSNKDEIFKYKINKINEDDENSIDKGIPTNGDFVLGIRPESLEITEDATLEGEVYGAMPTGMETTLKIRVNDYLLTSVVFGGIIYQIGSIIKFNIVGNNVCLFDRKSGNIIENGSLKII